MRKNRIVIALSAVALIACGTFSFVSAQEKADDKKVKPIKMTLKDYEMLSYAIGRSNGTRLAKSKFNPADVALFMRGMRSVFKLEKAQEGDADKKDFKAGAGIGKRLAAGLKKVMRYANYKSLAQGVEDALTGADPKFTDAQIAAVNKKYRDYKVYLRNRPHRLVGKAAPKWEVDKWYQLPAGKTSLDIADLKGKVVYIYCFQSWCPGCHKYGFPTLQALTKKYAGDKDVVFVAMQTVFEDRKTGDPVNTFENLKKIAKKYGLKIPFAQSGDRENKSKIMKAYKTRGTPWTIIIDKKGVIRFANFHTKPDKAATLIDKLKAEK